MVDIQQFSSYHTISYEMNIRPLTQLRELIATALKSQANIGKSFQSFFIETMEVFLTHTGRLNFTRMARCGRSCESRFRQNFKKPFDWFSFNRTFLEQTMGHRIAIAIDPCYIPKSGKKTAGVDWFWSGCAAAMKKGLEILGISMLTRNCKQLLSVCKLLVADAYFSKESFVTGVHSLGFDLVSRFRDDVRLRYLHTGPKLHKRGRPQKYAGRVDLKNLDMSVFVREQVPVDMKSYTLFSAVVNAISLDRDVRVVIADCEDADKKRQVRKVFFSTDTSMSAKDIFDIYKTRFQLEFVFRDAKQFPGLTHCQARNSQALSFAFNASLTSVNIAKAFASQQGMDLSVGSTKTLLHNAAMVERFISMSGKHADMRFNNTDFKELLFYGVRAAGSFL